MVYKNTKYEFENFVRPLWDWTSDLIVDPLLAPYFTWDACRMYRFDGKEWIRFIDEPWTADNFWEYQVCVHEV